MTLALHQRPVWLMLVSIIPCTFIASGKVLHSCARDQRQHGNLRLKMYQESESLLHSLSGLITESVRGRLTSLVSNSLHDSLSVCGALTGSLLPLSGQSVSSQAQAAHTIRALLSRSLCIPTDFIGGFLLAGQITAYQPDKVSFNPLKTRERSEILWRDIADLGECTSSCGLTCCE